MKKYIVMLLALIMALSLMTGCSGETGNDLNLVESGKLIMSTNAAFPPYEMTTDDGGFEGIDVEIAQAIADKLGLELVMDFSTSYATGVQVVIVKEGSDVTMENLGEKMIGTQRGTTGYIYASDTPENGGYGEDHVMAYDNGMSAVQALLNGQIDCIIIDKAPAEEFVAANPGLAILEGNWVEEQYAIGVDEGNTALLDAINEALNELIADGTVQSIIDKYITAE